MKARNLAALGLIFGCLSFGQTTTGLPGSNAGDRLNQQFLRQRREESKSAQRSVAVFPGDRVIPQFVDGGSWKTSMFFVNLENRSVSFQVLFFDDDGEDLSVPILGQGVVRGLNVTLDAAGSVTFETAGTAARLTQGWALLSQTTNDTVGGMAIFRQSVAGREQEAVVPIVSQYNNHFVLLFDNTNFTTAIALANPTENDVVIPVNIRNQAGQVIDQRTVRLGSYSHTAFTLPDTWGSTSGRRGAIEFLTSGFGVAALGLRFSGSAFTSFHVLENLNWVVSPPR
ncbi:MAG TPA: hypothetical protein VM120_30305 [Bryobacteraceae bacterium]|nr:hypothetical protein [Bryobacteraceae bacterium]